MGIWGENNFFLLEILIHKINMIMNFLQGALDWVYQKFLFGEIGDE